MSNIILHGRSFKPFIPNAQIESAIDSVAEKIEKDYANSEQVPMLLCVLTGSIMFTSGLMKRLTFPLEVITMRLSSYEGTASTGSIVEVMGLNADITGRDVIICEDIVDTGNTIIALKQMLLEKGAKSVKICTMLVKPEVFKDKAKLDYVGMEIPNKFIVGFGLDYDQLGRNIKDIYVLDE